MQSEIGKQRMAFKQMLSQIQTMTKMLWDVTETINQLYDWIEKKNAEKNVSVMEMEKTQNWLDQESKSYIQKINEEINKLKSLIMLQPNQEESEVYQRKEDLYEILAYIQDIDESIFKGILQILKEEKITDLLSFLSKTGKQKFQQYIVNSQANK
ncbi:unnamed protein product [Paramecium sonneborni]|uniref:Uncharacterized protein n=1 Tax=Paramecium sonneborni TaxID=65129 RepID=A0A8S1RRW9_9CILI|nr:unnamed protein product [Paramecium sonneborni]